MGNLTSSASARLLLAFLGCLAISLWSSVAGTPPPDWMADSNQPFAWFGESSASAGDVNGDGYSDVIVGALSYDGGQTDEGRAFVYLGSAAGLGQVPAWMAESDQEFAYFGDPVASAGDVNGDGHDDIIVGADHYDNGQEDEGRAYLFLGSALGPSSVPDWTVESNQAFAYFGDPAASAGDVNGDGYDDVIVGAGPYDNGQVDEGRAYVYHGSAAGLSAVADWTAEGNQANARFGSSVASAGDVNGDGYDDVIIGARSYDNGLGSGGRAWVYLGSADGLENEPVWIVESDQLNALFGRSVASAGDVNGDGYDDVLVGAPWYNNGQSNEGRAYLYLGSADGPETLPAWTAESNQSYANFGRPVASAGDVNGDGYADVIVAADHYTHGQSDEGRVYLYLGSADGLSEVEDWIAESDQAESQFGFPAATAGDVNGDGLDEVIVGAYWYDNGEIDEGASFLYDVGAEFVASAGNVPADTPLLLSRPSASTIRLAWGESCLLDGETDYEVYAGQLGEFDSHAPLYCSTQGQIHSTFFVLDNDDAYYLVVPRSASGEGSHGTNSESLERPRGQSTCLPQRIDSCE